MGPSLKPTSLNLGLFSGLHSSGQRLYMTLGSGGGVLDFDQTLVFLRLHGQRESVKAGMGLAFSFQLSVNV